jgi:hypothetical protein
MSSVQTSLTSPADKVVVEGETTRKPRQGAVLSEEQVEAAMNENMVDTFVKKFPATEKTFADPLIPGQVIGLHSFVPAKGATPDKDGVFGMFKFRGAFGTLEEAYDRAEYLIRNNDSYHKIFFSYCGKPFPATQDDRYVEKVGIVDIKDKEKKTISEDVKSKRDEEKAAFDYLVAREKALLDSTKEDGEDPIDEYITIRVKRANQIFHYLDIMKKANGLKENILRARRDLKDLEDLHPEVKEQWLPRYKETLEGLNLTLQNENWMKYLDTEPVEEMGF